MTSRPERYGRADGRAHKVARTLHYRGIGGAGREPVGPFRIRARQSKRRSGRVLARGMRHVAIALGAPVRFVADHVRFRRSPARGRPQRPDGWGPQPSGDREPRRPKPGPPTDAIALPIPRD